MQSEEEEEEEEEETTQATERNEDEPRKGFRRFCFARLEPGRGSGRIGITAGRHGGPLGARAAALAGLGIAVTLLYSTPLGNLFARLLVRLVIRSRDLPKQETLLSFSYSLLIRDDDEDEEDADEAAEEVGRWSWRRRRRRHVAAADDGWPTRRVSSSSILTLIRSACRGCDGLCARTPVA